MPSKAPLDILRPSFQHPARALADSLRARAPHIIWRLLHPLGREAFDEGGAPPPVERADVKTPDGWTLPVFALPARPGATGEPVVLFHTLGLGPDSFRYGRSDTLASCLTRRGFQVFLATVRGDRETVAPRARTPVRFEDIVRHDVPSVIAAVRARAASARVHVIGHGFGGQLCLGWLARRGASEVASMAVLSSPVRYTGALPGSTPLRLAGLLPAFASCPTRRLAKLAAPWLNRERSVSDGWGPRQRGALAHASEDIPVGLLRQLRDWQQDGALLDVDGVLGHGLALQHCDSPLWMGIAEGDTWCPPETVRPLELLWGSSDVTVHACPEEFGHLDLLLHPRASGEVFEPLGTWLASHRARAWGMDDVTDLHGLAVAG